MYCNINAIQYNVIKGNELSVKVNDDRSFDIPVAQVI